MKSAEHLRHLHPMHAFGVVSGLTKRVRISRLEQRLTPAVPFPHKHDFFHVVIPASGSGWHEIDFHRYEVEPRSIFVMKPAQVHSWILNDETTGFVVEFERGSLPAKTYTQPSVQKLLRSPRDCLAITPDEWPRLLDLCEFMAKEYEARSPDFEGVLQSCLTALLLAMARFVEDTGEEALGQDGFLNGFSQYLEEHYRQHHNVEFYAALLGMTAKALTMRISRATGRSARALIQDRIVLESKRLLAYSNLSVSEVADELGFEDPNYFSRFFRRKVQISPGRFSQEARSLSYSE